MGGGASKSKKNKKKSKKDSKQNDPVKPSQAQNESQTIEEKTNAEDNAAAPPKPAVVSVAAKNEKRELSDEDNAPKALSIDALYEKPRHQREPWATLLKEDILSENQAIALEPQQRQQLLDGTEAFARQPSRLVRVFLSSTFTDTEDERNLLIYDVLPYVKAYAQKHGFMFNQSEMRWGIRRESTDQHLTEAVCMAEILRCQQESAPHTLTYVLILGNKYGFTPSPAEIEQAVLDKIIEHISQTASTTADEDTALVKKWFYLDTNSVPPVYVLQPISHHLPDYLAEKEQRKAAESEWWGIFSRLQQILRQTALSLSQKDPSFDARPFVRSVTECEVAKGLFAEPEDNRVHSCLYVDRNFSAESSDQESEPKVDEAIDLRDKNAKLFVDMAGPAEVDTDAQKELLQLKESVKSIMPSSRQFAFKVPYVSGEGINPAEKSHAEYLRNFADEMCQKMVNSLQNAIREQSLCPSDALYDEARQHLSFACDAGEVCVGREAIVQKVLEYSSLATSATSSDNTQLQGCAPFALHGPSGVGKTSAIAAATLALLRAKASGEKLKTTTHIAPVFMGTSASSGTGKDLLQYLSVLLSEWYPAAAAGEKDSDSEGELELPDSYEQLVEIFHKRLGWATAEEPCILVLDSLDQLSDADGARHLEWLPAALPPHVAVVVSVLPDEGPCLQVLRAALPPGNIMEVCPLSAAVGEAMLKSWLAAYHRTLTPAQFLTVLEGYAQCPLPLYLKMAFHQALKWASYTPQEKCSLPHTVEGLIDAHYDKLAYTHGTVLTARVLGLLCASQHGLTLNELEDLLSLDEEVLDSVFEWWNPPIRRIPPLVLTRFLADLGLASASPPNANSQDSASSLRLQHLLGMRALATRGRDGGFPVMAWSHRVFAARTRTLYAPPHSSTTANLHAALAEYFAGKWAFEPKPYTTKENTTTSLPRLVAEQPLYLDTRSNTFGHMPNLRKLAEEIPATIAAGHWEQVLQLLTNPFVVEAFFHAHLQASLMAHYSEAAMRYPGGEPEILRSFRRFSVAQQHILTTHPSLLLQQGFNEPAVSPVAKCCAGIIEKLLTPQTKKAEEKGGGTDEFSMIAHLNKPKTLSATITLTIEAPLPLTGLCYCTNTTLPGNLLALISARSAAILIYSAQFGFQTAKLCGHMKPVTDVCSLPHAALNGSGLLSASLDGTLRIWELDECVEKMAIVPDTAAGLTPPSPPTPLLSVACSHDGRVVAAQNQEGKIFLLHFDEYLAVTKAVLLYSCPDPLPQCCCLCGNGRVLACSQGKGAVRVWRVEEETETPTPESLLERKNWPEAEDVLHLDTSRYANVRHRVTTLRFGADAAGAMLVQGFYLINTVNGSTTRLVTKCNHDVSIGNEISDGVLTPDGNMALLGTVHGNARLISTNPNQKDTTIHSLVGGHADRVERVLVSPDGREYCTYGNMRVVLWDRTGVSKTKGYYGTAAGQAKYWGNKCYSVSVMPDTSRFLCFPNSIRIYHFNTRTGAKTLEIGPGTYQSGGYYWRGGGLSPDGAVCVGLHTAGVAVYDMLRRTFVFTEAFCGTQTYTNLGHPFAAVSFPSEEPKPSPDPGPSEMSGLFCTALRDKDTPSSFRPRVFAYHTAPTLSLNEIVEPVCDLENGAIISSISMVLTPPGSEADSSFCVIAYARRERTVSLTAAAVVAPHPPSSLSFGPVSTLTLPTPVTAVKLFFCEKQLYLHVGFASGQIDSFSVDISPTGPNVVLKADPLLSTSVHTGPVREIVQNPLLPLQQSLFASISDDCHVAVWKAHLPTAEQPSAEFESVGVFPLRTRGLALAFYPTGHILVAADCGGDVYRLELKGVAGIGPPAEEFGLTPQRNRTAEGQKHNYITNGDFEEGPEHWTSMGSAPLSYAYGVAAVGKGSLLVQQRTKPFQGPAQAIRGLKHGEGYTFACAVKPLGPLPPEKNNRTIKVTMRIRESGFAKDWYYRVGTVECEDGEWSSMSVTFTLRLKKETSTIKQILLYLEADNTALSWYTDAVSLVKATE